MSEKWRILICAVSARSIRRKERRERVVKGRKGLGIEGAAEKDRECEARVCLSRCCLPRLFLRSSINETRMQSRRMSNKYVSYPSPPPSVLSYGRLLLSPLRQTTYPLPSRLSRYRFSSLLFFVNLSHTATNVSSVSAHFNPFACCPCSPTVFPFGFRTV